MDSTDFVDLYLNPETGLLRNLGACDHATLIAAEGRSCSPEPSSFSIARSSRPVT
jgi:hypothetical protein